MVHLMATRISNRAVVAMGLGGLVLWESSVGRHGGWVRWRSAFVALAATV